MSFFKLRYVRDYGFLDKVRFVIILIAEILLVVLLGILLTVGFGKKTVMQESSMDPTLEAGQVFLIDRVSYKMGSPKRGDIIAFKLSDDPQASTHIKRIIGLPGETIQIRDGQILIDGETYKEQKNFPSIQNAGLAEDTITLKSDEYFVLGDNRNNSEDSRFADVGNITKNNIIGKLWFTVSPLSEFGFISR